MVFFKRKSKKGTGGKRAFKRKSFKRRSTKGKSRVKRRKVVSRKRKATPFGSGLAPRIKRLPNPRSLPDAELMWMTTTATAAFAPINLDGDDVNCANQFQWAINDIYTPTFTCTGQGSNVLAMPIPTGFTAQTLLYRQWQVREAKIMVELTAQDDDLVCAEDWMLVALDQNIGANYASIAADGIPWESARALPHRGPIKTLQTGSNGRASTIRLRMKNSPHQLNGIPGYYSNPISYSPGPPTTPSTDQPRWALLSRHTNAMLVGQLVQMRVTISFAVRWFNRGITPTVIPEAILPPHPIPESKEEKKEDYDGVQVMSDMTEEFKSMRMPPPTPPPSPVYPGFLPPPRGPSSLGRLLSPVPLRR